MRPYTLRVTVVGYPPLWLGACPSVTTVTLSSVEGPRVCAGKAVESVLGTETRTCNIMNEDTE